MSRASAKSQSRRFGAGAGSLLPFPYFAVRIAGAVVVVFECTAKVVHARELLRSCAEEKHATVANGTTSAELAHAGAGPRDCVAVSGHDQSLALAVDRAAGLNARCVGAHAVGLDAQQRAGVFKCDFRGWWVDGQNASHYPRALCFENVSPYNKFPSLSGPYLACVFRGAQFYARGGLCKPYFSS